MKTAPRIRGSAHAAVAHDSAANHVRGHSVFVDDMREPAGTLHAALVVSPHAHARVESIDSKPAGSLEGVHTVLTAEDIPGANDVAPIFAGEPLLAQGTATYFGQPLAMVVAESLDVARAAAGSVAVEFEPLGAVLEIEEALSRGDFTSPPQTIERGDPGGAIDAAPHRVRGSFSAGGQEHFYLEGQVALAVPEEDSQLRVFSSTQHPTEAQHVIARVLDLDSNAVIVETKRLGGGFGGKESQATQIAALAALGAAATARPVKLRLVREMDMIVTGKRHDFLYQYEAGFDDAGRIEGIDLVLAARAGNVADLSSAVLNRAVHHVDNCYFLPNISVRGYPCRTNTVSNTAFRGFGGPQGMLAIEAVIDHVARERGLDPDDVRRVNYYSAARGDTTHYGQVIEDELIVEMVEKLEGLADYRERKRAVAEFNDRNRVLKKGIALMPSKFGISFNVVHLNQAGALVHVYTDGSVHLGHGGVEMGQGLFVKVAQVVASTFQIDIDRIRNAPTSTDQVPNTSATSASSGSDLNGMAARDAALKIRDRMARVAARQFEVGIGQVEFLDNSVRAGEASISFAELAELCWRQRVSLSATGFYATPKIGWDASRNSPRPFFYFCYGVGISEVVIDTLTGECRVLRADILQDCGDSLNPAIDVGQIEGGYVQGMGWLTMEQVCWDDRGALLTRGPSTYKIPGSRDVPPVFNVHLLEDSPNREPTIFRSKAVGEPPLMLAISAWLAIRDAVASAGGRGRPLALEAPATAEAILGAIEDLRARRR